ncbi:hypothetical protein Acr_00g0070720 [Actinidia rufa]|uniref:Uncharacterized protein n=1 Tax=Actinidia rufa TaxID=165716 RepID=A0A7J0DSP9_9ERIC|nr:hypothetical protein Acr_00g0070720 [Actinidia rufa]
MRKLKADTSEIVLPFGFCRGAPSLTTSFNNCTLTTVSPAAGAVSGKRLSDGQVVHLLFTSAEGLVVLPAIMNFHARIWAEHRAPVVQASPCPVSSSGFPPISGCQPSCGVTVGAAVKQSGVIPELR